MLKGNFTEDQSMVETLNAFRGNKKKRANLQSKRHNKSKTQNLYFIGSGQILGQWQIGIIVERVVMARICRKVEANFDT